MRVADYIAHALHQHGVAYIYEVIGGMITRLVDAVYQQGKIQLISMHHEQAAAFAADATGRITGIPGVAMATSGPGAINLLTGIGSCYFDSVPSIFITGQVNRNEQKGARPIRQLGFQETDIVALAAPITKAAWQIIDPNQVPQKLEEAFHLATSGRCGPVLLDIPMDVQGEEINAPMPLKQKAEELLALSGELIKDLTLHLSKAKKPLILVGGGIHSADAVQLLRQFVNITQIPVVSSLLAIDTLSYSHPLHVGFLGTYGNRWANLALGRADLILVLGSRLDIRQTGSDVAAFKAGRNIYHVDIEKNEINSRVSECIPIISHLRPFLIALLSVVSQEKWDSHKNWISEIQELRRQWPDTREIQNIPGINPNVFMHELSRSSKLASVFVVDVGNHQMWAAQSLELNENQRLITSGGMGAMGFALPAAVGATHSTGRPVVMITGDGGMQLNIQELETIGYHKLPIKMVVLNNKSLGMVRQFQQSYFSGRYPATFWGYSTPDFSMVARAYRIESLTISDKKAIPEALEKTWMNPREPFLLQVILDVNANAYPKISFGKPITEMEPFIKSLDMEGTKA